MAGEDDAIDAYISAKAFDVLCTPFSLTSGWKERLRLKAAVERDMGIFGYRYYPEHLQRTAVAASQAVQTLRSAARPLEGMGTYAFLENTGNWKGEELCLAYALTEPCLSSVQIVADRPDRLESLAAISERDLPPGVGAQIEMARFSPAANAERARRA